MPYFCYLHHGLYVKGEADGCHYDECLEFAAKEVRPVGVSVSGFGGSDATKISRHNFAQFHRDMYAYKSAVDQGVNPDQITVKAAEASLKKAEAGE